jgi:hypothetical protein
MGCPSKKSLTEWTSRKIAGRASVVIILSHCTLAHSQSLDFDAMCKAQAEKEFQKGGWNDTEAWYQNHYNTKLKKCLMLIESRGRLGAQGTKSLTLPDAYEGRVYATYFWVSDKVKKYWEVPPRECTLIPSFSSKRYCETTEEFDEFVAEYLEE